MAGILKEYLSALIEFSPLKDTFAAWTEKLGRDAEPPAAADLVVPDPARLDAAAVAQVAQQVANSPVCYYVGFATLFFSLSLYMQHGLNFSALETGFAFVPFGLTILVSATVLAPRLLRRFGLRTPNGGGLALSSVGYILLAGLTAHGTYLADVLPGLIPVERGAGRAG